MSIPLERLYHYIEDVASKIHGDRVLIYRFWPHGSKNINNLTLLSDCNNWIDCVKPPEIYCNDQEPLNWQYYQESERYDAPGTLSQKQKEKNIIWEVTNFRRIEGSIWDKALLLHSEKNSAEVELYQQSRFITIYYWTHGILARDWFRYAKHVNLKKTHVKTKFLIYNRAWSGTREYRLKFSDLLVENNLVNDCQTWFNKSDPESNIHYTQHTFANLQWAPTNSLEDFFHPTAASSNSSADFNIADYTNTNFEVVLETLFADQRLYLTEKILRPIALGHPFLLVSAAGGLKYLRDYGFKTFDPIIDETYDTVTDHETRLKTVVKAMLQITKWSNQERINNMIKLKEITDYNRHHFFSDTFLNLILDELKHNLTQGLTELEETNTSRYYLEMRQKVRSDPEIFNLHQSIRTEEEALEIFKKARNYYLRSLNSM